MGNFRLLVAKEVIRDRQVTRERGGDRGGTAIEGEREVAQCISNIGTAN